MAAFRELLNLRVFDSDYNDHKQDGNVRDVSEAGLLASEELNYLCSLPLGARCNLDPQARRLPFALSPVESIGCKVRSVLAREVKAQG